MKSTTLVYDALDSLKHNYGTMAGLSLRFQVCTQRAIDIKIHTHAVTDAVCMHPSEMGRNGVMALASVTFAGYMKL